MLTSKSRLTESSFSRLWEVENNDDVEGFVEGDEVFASDTLEVFWVFDDISAIAIDDDGDDGFSCCCFWFARRPFFAADLRKYVINEEKNFFYLNKNLISISKSYKLYMTLEIIDQY